MELDINTIWIFLFCITGPALPYGLTDSAMAKFSDGRGVLLFGGYSMENTFENRILELCAGADSWNVLNITLEVRRNEHIVIPLQWFISIY